MGEERLIYLLLPAFFWSFAMWRYSKWENNILKNKYIELINKKIVDRTLSDTIE